MDGELLIPENIMESNEAHEKNYARDAGRELEKNEPA